MAQSSILAVFFLEHRYHLEQAGYAHPNGRENGRTGWNTCRGGEGKLGGLGMCVYVKESSG